MSRKNTSPDPPGEDIFLTSSPCWRLQYCSPKHGFSFPFSLEISESSSFAFFGPATFAPRSSGSAFANHGSI